jgi:hypothetical protein
MLFSHAFRLRSHHLCLKDQGRCPSTPCCAYSLLCHAHSNIWGADLLSLPGRTHHCSWQQDVPLRGSPPSLILKVLPYHLLAACSCGAECVALAGHYVSKSLRNKSNMLCTVCSRIPRPLACMKSRRCVIVKAYRSVLSGLSWWVHKFNLVTIELPFP